MQTPRLTVLIAASLSVAITRQAIAQDDGWRTIEFETTEVTAADVAVSPEGQWLIFTMLGHLFRLPVEGGTAEQLTFGPYYDSDPVFSPDGRRVAFVSDRDGSEGNVFVLELADGQITQVTHELWAGRPTWSLDGQAIAYLRFLRDASAGFFVLSEVRRVALRSGRLETVSAPTREFGSVFYLPDGRLAWTIIERKTGSPRATTRIEVLSPQGAVSPLRTVEGIVHRVVASPTDGGLYYRRYLQLYDILLQPEDLLFLPLPEGDERQIVSVSGWHFWWWRPRFSVASDNKTLYVGDSGRLWKIGLPSGAREPIAFRARVQQEIQDPVPPPRWEATALGGSAPPRSVLDPRLSPDGGRLIFGAAGYLWQLPLNSARGEPSGVRQATRLFQGSAFERAPASSPDGRQLAFIRSEYGKQEVRVFNFENRQERTLAYGLRYGQPSWTSEGERLVFTEYEYGTASMVAVNLSDGKKEKLADRPGPSWSPRPHLSADGESLYYSANPTGTGTLYRLPLKGKAKPQPITQLARHLNDGLISPDGKWLAFRRNSEIWVAPLGTEPVEEKDVHQLSPEGGDSFDFTADGSAVTYSAGNRVWHHPLGGGEPEEIPIRLELQHPTPPPVLVRRVRVLDFDAGGFGPETSLFIEQGRIRWIGSQRGRRLPRETVVLDGGGRFAIPGLFDAHVHNIGSNQAAFLAYGITSVRDPGGGLAHLNAMADRGGTTGDPGPRYFFSGDIFHGAQPFFGGFLQIVNEGEARTYVRRWKEQGVQFIKVYTDLPWPLQRAVAEEARLLDLPVAGHGMSVEEITKSVTLGYAVLEHVSMNHRLYDDVLQMLAAAGTRWDLTLGVLGGNALLLREEPERLADAKLRVFASEQALRTARIGWNAIGARVLRGYLFEQLAGIRAAHRRGVKLLAGTDTGPRALLGSSLHWELEFFAQAGLVPLEVLRIATQEGAAAVGAEDDLGTLEVGKLADIVLLDANPLEDIKNTQSIWRVIKGGWVFDPEELQAAATSTGN